MDYLLVIMAITIVLLIGVIYYLLVRRRFSIKSIPTELENFLLSLDENINEYSLYTQNRLNKMNANFEKYKISISKELALYGDEFSSNLQSSEITLNQTVGILKNNLGSVNSELVEIKNQLNALQQYTIEKDKKIRRFEEGYDFKIQKDFVKDIIEMIDYMEKQNQKEPSELVSEMIDDLLLMLENRSIYAIEFEENESYIGNEVIAKVNSVEESSDKEKENIIKEVSKKGFYIELENEEKKIIRPAGVIVYKFTQRDE
jgi:molecular chaperone GrpE (heat shock protein)